MRFDVEVVPGLEEFAEREIQARLPEAEILGRPREGRLALDYDGSLRRLDTLKTVVAVYRVESFDVSRPRGLLGHQSFQRLIAAIRRVLEIYPAGRFATFHLSAAGADSPTFARFKVALAEALRIPATDGPGDLSLGVRRPLDGSPGWDALIRVSPRPLSARAWRVCDWPGALNATVARAMGELTDPSPSQRFLNLACGSGTLLIERLDLGPARPALGVDRDPAALACAVENALASGHARDIRLLRADATRLPLPSASVDALVADLPYGMLVGSQRENAVLYPAILAEAARVAASPASFVAITARHRLFESALQSTRQAWSLERAFPLKIPFRSGYLRPTIYQMRRT
ncbi:MAG: methyltransferase domain-containing protein [Chloroflexota bacterium]